MSVTAHPPGDIGSALTWAAGRLRQAGVEDARRDARLLLVEVLGGDTAKVVGHPERQLGAAEQAAFEDLISRRAAREPVARILGRREFWSLEFALSPETLDPRPDSETLVEAVLARVVDRSAPLSVLDLGTGTGCLLLALLSELPQARGLGVDLSNEAVAVAQHNARSLGLADRACFRRGDWSDDVSGIWQVIISNPPYIKDGEISDLAPEVARYEPRMALSGGADGLSAYRSLAPRVARLLAPQGILAFEVGEGQADKVEQLLGAAGLSCQERVTDLARIERGVIATR